jgi:hypothetical protein
MKMRTLALAMTLAAGLPAWVSAQTNITDNDLIQNGGFDNGSTDWSNDGNGAYFYTQGSNTIISIGWVNGVGFWQNTGATIQPGLDYVLTLSGAVGQTPLSGVNLSFQDVTTGWTWVTNADFLFPSQTEGVYYSFSLYVSSNVLSGLSGDTIGVGVQLVENPTTQYGWLWADWVQLAPAVPQFTLQPQSTTNYYYGSATFTAAAIGAVTNTTGKGSTLLYQWYKAPSTLLAGATNTTLTLTNLASTNAGSYYVVASGPYGTNASSNAVLTVTSLTITLDGSNTGRVFQGLGAVSASATSRLLIDYPEPQRSQVLDYLFKPNYGAALQHLKVEIGGEVNSTCGCESTHQRTATETNYTRGWEWWLMQQARQRNPSILLDSLAWGAPGWIGGGTYYSQDMANYIANFLNGAKNVYGLNINYTGVRNEVANDPSWIELLRATLNSNGLQSVSIVAGDEWNGTWNIVTNIAADSTLAGDVYAVGAHYPTNSPAAAQSLGKPIWASEDGPGGGNWDTATFLASRYNRNYILRRLSATEIWCPITAYYDVLPAALCGLMTANTPWSGNYAVQPAIWATAHTTQFTQPGWTYLEGGASALLPQGGSVVALKSTNDTDWTVVFETSDASVAQTATFHIVNGLSTGPVYVWSSTSSAQFQHVATITPVNGSFVFSIQPDAIYTLTTTTGQAKGSASPPAAATLALPYLETFESYASGAAPRYFSDQAGTFEVTNRADGQGQALAQVLPQKGIEWTGEFNPYSVVGDSSWTDYEVNTDVLLNTNEWVYIWGRLNSVPGWSSATPSGYWLVVSNHPGVWQLRNASGVISSGSVKFAAGVWHNLRLDMQGSWLQAWVDGTQVASLTDTTYTSGLAGVGCGWTNFPQFDNFTVRQLHCGEPNLARSATVSASSYWDSTLAPAFANDGDFTTRWNSAYPPMSQEWLELDFPAAFRYNSVLLDEFTSRIEGYYLQHWTNGAWADDYAGSTIGGLLTDAISMTSSTKERLLITNMNNSPSIYEFQVYNVPQRPGSIRVNEWMINNTGTLADPADGQFHSWFELYNAGTTNFSLSGYYLTGTPTNLVQFQIPSGYSLAPGAYLLVWADGGLGTNQPGQPLHVNFSLPQSSLIGLYAADGSQVDAVKLSPQPANVSYGSKTDGDLAILPLAVATPGAGNGVISATAAVASNNSFAVTFSGLPFAAHQIQASPTLQNPVWTNVATLTANALGGFSYVDTNAASFSQRFYRAVAP